MKTMKIENGIVCVRGDEMEEFMKWAKEQLDYEAMSFKQAVEKFGGTGGARTNNERLAVLLQNQRRG
ncbi:hypothetical protein WJ0W_004590 [Paenibacillus melissococcoides]|uniref:Uncharacterized protein n=1 Tax=Paenibacillus melissococcoides TaxID=2912268 RepID=A0ABM9G804_9BACL|nr:hypothetical protein [Paenibacillus melissococcoides]CAH8247356.1 hypothetical protein WJ0W_004590 [Paenibacillus melissococcoides]